MGTDYEFSVAGSIGVLISLVAPWPMGQIAEVLSDDQLSLAFFAMFLHVIYVGGLVTEACFPARFITTALKIPQPVFLAIKIVYTVFASWEFSGHGDMSYILVGILLATLVLTQLGVALKREKVKDKKIE